MKDYCRDLEKKLNDAIKDKELELAKQKLEWEQEKGRIKTEYYEKTMAIQEELNQFKMKNNGE